MHTLQIVLLLACIVCSFSQTSGSSLKPVVVVGSLNVDITVEVTRLPNKDETVTARSPSTRTALGGKGANQAVAVARLISNASEAPKFVCQLGNDAHAKWLERVLIANNVDISGCRRSDDLPSGQGLVMLDVNGSASSIVVGGSNSAWPERSPADYVELVHGAGAVLLQREVPENVNVAVARAAASIGVKVIQDVGGEDRAISNDLLSLLDYLCPNEGELQRLTGLATKTEEQVVTAARSLQARGAKNVLVTLGSRGALLVLSESTTVLRQTPLAVPGGKVLDATAAGDAFRAAFAVALVEGKSLEDCLSFAAAAGAIAVSRQGAEPSLPRRTECEALLAGVVLPDTDHIPAGACVSQPKEDKSKDLHPFPKKFASRLNSMRSQLEKWTGGTDLVGLISRQGTVRGLDLVYFNYPQHLEQITPEEVKIALAAAGLSAGGVAMRFPEEMGTGAFTAPDEAVRQQAITLTLEGCEWASAIGADELVIWPQTDGYDYQLQVDYPVVWSRAVNSFRQVADSVACLNLKISLEFKPTDAISRFTIVPSTGAALLFIREVDRSNVGLTLDVGHLLMAGENPAQSVALVGAAGKLFGVHLNDGHSRIGAEDGLMFGSVHSLSALELVVWLQKINYEGSIYFDTFPKNEDPVREAEYNIRRFKALWQRAQQLRDQGLDALMSKHDALGALELVEGLREQVK